MEFYLSPWWNTLCYTKYSHAWPNLGFKAFLFQLRLQVHTILSFSIPLRNYSWPVAMCISDCSSFHCYEIRISGTILILVFLLNACVTAPVIILWMYEVKHQLSLLVMYFCSLSSKPLFLYKAFLVFYCCFDLFFPQTVQKLKPL